MDQPKHNTVSLRKALESTYVSLLQRDCNYPTSPHLPLELLCCASNKKTVISSVHNEHFPLLLLFNDYSLFETPLSLSYLPSPLSPLRSVGNGISGSVPHTHRLVL